MLEEPHNIPASKYSPSTRPLPASLTQRSIRSLSWNIGANIIILIVGLARSIILARLLPVDVFGIYAFGSAIVSLSSVPAFFGLGWAFMFRAPETENEDLAAANYLSLQLIFTSAWLLLLLIYTLHFAETPLHPVLIVLGLATAVTQVTQPPRLILARRVVHKRLALLQISDVILGSLVAVTLALHHSSVWVLLSTDIVGMLLTLGAFYGWKPVWKPRLAWTSNVIHHLLNFGSQQALSELLLRALDQVDDLWTGAFLGKTAAGFYSRAYTLATYPRKILAVPLNLVAGGAYAELKDDRLRRSQAFFRFNAILIRSGFLLGGWLSLIAPEFISLVLGNKWLPMLSTFRLMLVYTLLDPFKLTIADLLIAIGKPREVARTRILQLLVMLSGLFLLGPRWNIEGVALAVNIMLVIGIVLFLWKAKHYVDFSLWRLFGPPTVALVTALGAGHLMGRGLASITSDWIIGAGKSVVFWLTYSGILVALEHHFMLEMIPLLVKALKE